MFILNASQVSELDFDVALEGVGVEDLSFWLRLHINEVSYGFPGEYTSDGKIRVTLPKLDEVITKLDKNITYNATLEILGEHYYLDPWREKFQIKVKPKARVNEAKIKEKKKNIKVSAMSVDIKEVKKDKPRDKIIEKKEQKVSVVDSVKDIVTMDEENKTVKTKNKKPENTAKSTILALKKALKSC